MQRRDFIESITAGLIVAGTRLALLAQPASHPKIMLFGLTAITKDGQAIKAVLPAVSNHGAFLCGPAKLIQQLANGNKTSSGPKGTPSTSSRCL